MARIGILGGTFDPLHEGHIAVARIALSSFSLDKVLFTPTNDPVFKQNQEVTVASLRIERLQESLRPYPQFAISDVDIVRGGITYTVDTIHDLKNQYPDDELYFLAGADVLPNLHKWKNLTEILQLCVFVVVARSGYDLTLTPQIIQQADRYVNKIKLLEANTPDISSTSIRT